MTDSVLELLTPGCCYYAEFPDSVRIGQWHGVRFCYFGLVVRGSTLFIEGFSLDDGEDKLYSVNKIGDFRLLAEPWQAFLRFTRHQDRDE